MVTDLAARLDRSLRGAGIAILSVSIGDPNDRTTWTVQPASLQGSAQPIIDAFNVADPAVVGADLANQESVSLAQKDLIATLALLAQQTDPSWGAYTLAQKIAKVQALMTTWKAMRTFVENNL